MLFQRLVLGLEREEPYEINILGETNLSFSACNVVLGTKISNAFRNADFTKEKYIQEEFH